MTQIIAGFECGTLPWNGHDLLVTTRHMPTQDMRKHYRMIKSHGMTWCRDGLKTDDVFHRMIVAHEEKINVIYDLAHYHRYNDPEVFALNIARKWLSLHGPDKEFWCVPANEPSIVPIMRPDMSRQESIDIGYVMINVLKSFINVKVLSVDVPGSDAFSDIADIIGINLYPHTIDRPIHEYLIETHQSFDKPVAITETSWHDGFHEGYAGKAGWLWHVIDEVNTAKSFGVDIRLICWYPIVDCPNWNDPNDPVRWSHGLIQSEGLDGGLSKYVKEITTQETHKARPSLL